MKFPSLRTDIYVPFLFIILGGFWIIVSDNLLVLLVTDPSAILGLQTYKGWAFVGISALLLFTLLRQERILRTVAENKTIEIEEYYRLLFENSFDAILITDFFGRIIQANSAARRILEITEAEIKDLGSSRKIIETLLHVEFKELTGNSTGFHGEVNLVRKDGRKLPVEVSTVAFVDKNGNALTCFIMRDITGQKKAEKSTRENEERFRALVERSPEGIGVHRNGKVIYVNPAGLALFGAISAEEMIGKPILDLVHPDYHKFVIERTKKIRNNDVTDQVVEEKFLKLDGTVMDVEVRSILIEFEGLPAIQIMAHDITGRKLTETALKESNERLNVILENSPIALWDWNIKTDHWFATQKYFTMLGYEPETGFPDRNVWLERVHPDDQESVRMKIANVANHTEENYSYDARMLHADGSYKWHSVIGNVIERDQDGKATRMLGIRMDITERKNAEASSKRLSQLYATLSLCNQDIVHSANREILFPEICRNAVVTGEMKMAWIGLIDKTDNQVRPAASYGDDDGYLKDIRVSVDDTDPMGNGPTGIAVRENRPYWCQDFLNDPATKAWQERGAQAGWAASASLPLHCEGAVIGALTLYSTEVNAFDEDIRKLLVEMAADISFALDGFAREAARRHAEEALLLSEKDLKKAQQVARVGNWKWEIKTNRLEWSDEMFSIFGIEKKTFTGILSEVMEKAIHPEDRPILKLSTESVIQQGKAAPLEFRVVWPDNTVHNVWADLGELISDASGNPTMLSGIVQDITERKQAEEMVKKSYKLKSLGEMAAGIAHELNQPLTVIKLAAESIKSELLEKNIDTDFLTVRNDKIQTQVKKASEIIDQIKTFGRSEGPEFSFFELNKSLTSTIRLLKETMSLNEIKIDFLPENNLPRIFGNQNQMEQVFINILTNAIHSLSDDSENKNKKITVTTAMNPSADCFEIEIGNNGPSIPETIERKIFDPFFTTKGVGKGTGLGLSISNTIVSLHHGEIKVRDLGNGPIFILKLPVTESKKQTGN